MGGSRGLRLGALLALGAAAAAILATAADAGKVFRDTIHEEESDILLEDFCGVSGLNVNLSFVLDVDVHVVPHGKDQLDYFLQHGTRTDEFTNLANGKTITSVGNVIEKDKLVTDNGDGTLTILILATGNATLYGTDGKAVARNPGQVRFEILVDHGGTPTDPSDDVFLADLGVVKESTGRSDDFCGAAVPALS